MDFYDVYNFETYMNGFLDLEYPNFDPKHGFLSSVEAFEGGSLSKFDKYDIETWLKKRVSFICSVTMFNTILFYACHVRQITCNFST